MLLFPVPETVLYGHQKPGLAGAGVLWPVPGAGSGEFDSGGPAEPQVVSGRVKGRPPGPGLWGPPGGAMEGREAGAGSVKGEKQRLAQWRETTEAEGKEGGGGQGRPSILINFASVI